MKSLTFLDISLDMQFLLNLGLLLSMVKFTTLIFRYMHINMRPWDKGAVITDPYNPPPAALSVERIVIDLAKMEVVGRSHPRQRIFIPSDNEFREQNPIQV